MAMWHASTDTPTPARKVSPRPSNLTYLSSGLVVSLCRRDLILALVSAGCSHLAISIFQYLDSASLLACSLVCVDWQRLLLASIYTTSKFRRKVRQAIFEGMPIKSELTLSLDMTRAAVVDVALDDDFNIFALAVLGGRPHVMSCSLFGLGKKRWIHRFSEHFELASLSCIAAGQSLVALGSKDGKIRLYECNHQFRNLKLIAVLAYHKGAVHSIKFSDTNYIVSCSDDMTLGIVSIPANGSLILSKRLHGHVSRVRSIDVQNGKVISGSDDRSVKLWSLEESPKAKGSLASEKPLTTMTGHSGPVTGVQLSLPFALSVAGSTVRLWNVLQGTCLKLLQHDEDSPVTTMTWISTFKGIATVDTRGKLRCFDLFDLETSKQEIICASAITDMHQDDNAVQHYSPKQNSKFYGSRDPRVLSPWPENAIFKLESIPHHFAAFSLSNVPLPTITVHCLDYIH